MRFPDFCRELARSSNLMEELRSAGSEDAWIKAGVGQLCKNLRLRRFIHGAKEIPASGEMVRHWRSRCPIVGGLDIHRKQITFDYLDTVTGEVRRGGRMLQQTIQDAGAVEPGRDREAPGDGGGPEPAGLLHPPDVQLPPHGRIRRLRCLF